MLRKLILSHNRSVGDIITMTALVRDLHLTYPGQFVTAPETKHKGVWKHNPYCVKPPSGKDRKGWEYYHLSYGEPLNRNWRTIRHFLTAWYENFYKLSGIEVPLLLPKPDLHLSDDEKRPLIEGRYWVVLSGGKSDFVTKHPVHRHVQMAVDALVGVGLRFVQAGSASPDREQPLHPPLRNVTDMVGQTDLRNFIRLIYHADGVMCTITAAMHIAAAFDKPCVVWGGGREEPNWEAYTDHYSAFGKDAKKVRVPHRYLHTMGLLPCCMVRACWRNKVSANSGDRSVCKLPIVVHNQEVPTCQAMITPEKIVESVLSYYMDGTLSPASDVTNARK